MDYTVCTLLGGAPVVERVDVCGNVLIIVRRASVYSFQILERPRSRLQYIVPSYAAD